MEGSTICVSRVTHEPLVEDLYVRMSHFVLGTHTISTSFQPCSGSVARLNQSCFQAPSCEGPGLEDFWINPTVPPVLHLGATVGTQGEAET